MMDKIYSDESEGGGGGGGGGGVGFASLVPRSLAEFCPPNTLTQNKILDPPLYMVGTCTKADNEHWKIMKL